MKPPTIPIPPRLGPPPLPGGRPSRPPRKPRRIRALFWVALLGVAVFRFLMPQEVMQPFRGRGPVFEFQPNRGQRRFEPHGERPVAEIPADLYRIQIEITPRNADILRRSYWNGGEGNNDTRPEVLATVREGSMVYSNVAIHLKGAAGSFQPFDAKPGLTLSFSKHVSGRRFHGYNKISLNNSVQDRSFLCEAISREMFQAAGVPVPKVEHATVVINGRDLGLYVLAEGWGKPFLKRYFKDVSGNLYDSGFVQDVNGNMTVNSGDDRDDHAALERLASAATEEDPARRWQRLTQVLDVDRFMSFLALEVLTCHWDGYGMNRNNYRVFHDRETDRMVFMPHGMDQLFGGGRSSPTSSIFPSMRGLVARAVMTTREGRAMYLERLKKLREEIFVEEKLTNRVREIAEKVRPTLAAYGEHAAADFDANVSWLSQRISERVRSVSDQLEAPRAPVPFDPEGGARLTGWTPRITSQGNTPPEFERTEMDGVKLLKIRIRRGGAGSWRTRTLLEAGQYRFEGRVLTKDVGSGGVCLRISGGRARLVTTRDDEWTTLRFGISIGEAMSEEELVCELNAQRGEAWFDEGSLRLVRE